RIIRHPDRAVTRACGRASPTAAARSITCHAERTCFRIAGPRERCRLRTGILGRTWHHARDGSFTAAGNPATPQASERPRDASATVADNRRAPRARERLRRVAGPARPNGRRRDRAAGPPGFRYDIAGGWRARHGGDFGSAA